MTDTCPFEALLGEIPAVDDPLGGLNDLDTDLDSFGALPCPAPPPIPTPAAPIGTERAF